MWYRWLIAVACVGLLGGIPKGASGQTANLTMTLHRGTSEWAISSPSQFPAPVRITMRTSTATMLSPCYHPVQFRVFPAAGVTFPSDGTVTILMRYRGNLNDSHSATLDIPVRAGEAIAESAMLVGPTHGRYGIEVRGAWNGTYHPRLAAQLYTSWYGYDDLPSRADLMSPESATSLANEGQQAFASLNEKQLPLVLALDPTQEYINQPYSGFPPFTRWSQCLVNVQQMPDNWLHLAHLHHVSAILDDLKKLDEAGRRVLRRYVWCGGLLVLRSPASPEDLAEIIPADWERAVRLPGSPDTCFRAGLGGVVIDPKSEVNWGSVNHQSRLARLSRNLEGDYWNWLIPEVGKTPIWTFLGMVTLLVGIGAPAILIWSQRMQRRIWIILLIPLLSLVSVMSLFAYGTVKDGWGSRVRTRSITTLDAYGNGAVWSRQTYYAGSIPDGRIRVGAQVELIPLRYNKPLNNTSQFQDAPEGDQLYAGVLSLRQQKQVSLAHWVEGVPLLRMASSPLSAPNIPTTKNISEVTITAIVGSDASGRTFRAENILPGDVVQWQETDRDDAARWLRSFYDAQKLELPSDAPDGRVNSIFDWMFYSRNWGNGPSSAGFQEEEFWTEALSSWGPDTPYKYVAVVDRAPRLEKCLENARETHGLHMVVGRWLPGSSSAETDGKGLQQ
jgi:hypothetical protein